MEPELKTEVAALDKSGADADGGESGEEEAGGDGLDAVRRWGVAVELDVLHDWRPASVAAFSGAVRRIGKSPLQLHLSLLSRGARLPGGCFAPPNQLSPSGEWIVKWCFTHQT